LAVSPAVDLSLVVALAVGTAPEAGAADMVGSAFFLCALGDRIEVLSYGRYRRVGRGRVDGLLLGFFDRDSQNN
jgi:hypothetical protein